MVCSSSLARLNPEEPPAGPLGGEGEGEASSGETSEGTASTASGGDDRSGDDDACGLAGDPGACTIGGKGDMVIGEGGELHI